MTRRIALLAYEGAQVLDLTGPAAVFANANRVLARPVYDVQILSSTGGALRLQGDVTVHSRPLSAVRAASVHTVLVVGGAEQAVRAAARDRALARFLKRVSRSCERYGSVCSGTFVLAAHGLLDGKRVTTHWEGSARLAELFPKLTVDADALYIEDGRVWTSAGVTAGIDMALALVARDVGAEVAAKIAQNLVLYQRRPGFQSQFSPLLGAQRKADAPFGELVDWIHAHLTSPLSVELLARRAGQSLRTFQRHFTSALGSSPAHFVEQLRLERARTLLAEPLSLKEVAARSGFADAVHLSRAFERRFGVRPGRLRESLARAGSAQPSGS